MGNTGRVVVSMSLGVFAATVIASAQGTFPDPAAAYYIETSTTGMCARMQDAGSEDRKTVWQWPCGSGPEYQFKLEPARDGYFRIKTANGKCLHVQNQNNAQRNYFLQWSCRDTDEFLFRFPEVQAADGRGNRLIQTKYDTCYHVRGGPSTKQGDDAALWTWACQPGSREFWFRFTTSRPTPRIVPVGVITGTGTYNGPPGFGRGMQATQYCGNDPESWVRGSATLDTSNGRVQMTVQLETDSNSAGPRGRVRATAREENGHALVELTSDEIGRGGKAGGRSAIQNFSSALSIRPEIAVRARSMTLVAECTGRVPRLFNIRIGDVENAFAIVAKYFAAASGQ